MWYLPHIRGGKGENTMPSTEGSKEYIAWLEEQRKLAAKGDEAAQSRVVTADRLALARRTREFQREHEGQ